MGYNKEKDFEEEIKKLLESLGFKLLKVEGYKGPDFLVKTEDGQILFVEAKSKPDILYRDVAQLIRYALETKSQGGYLAVPSSTALTTNAERLMEKYGIGLIRAEDKDLKFIKKPDKEKIFQNLLTIKDKQFLKSRPEKERKKIEQLILDGFKKLLEDLEQKEVKTLPSQIIIFVFIAGFFGSVSWHLYQKYICSYFKNCDFLSFVILLIIVASLILFLRFKKQEVKKYN